MVCLPHQNNQKGGVSVRGNTAILAFSQKIPSAWRCFSNGRRMKRGGGEKFFRIRHSELQLAPDRAPAFGCHVFIGCCGMPQFGSYISLLAVGDLSLMNLSTVHGVDNKNFKISL